MDAAVKTEYRDAADAIRSAATVTPEMEARYAVAKAAYDAARPKPAPVKPGWWNLPVAASMWADDGRDLNA